MTMTTTTAHAHRRLRYAPCATPDIPLAISSSPRRCRPGSLPLHICRQTNGRPSRACPSLVLPPRRRHRGITAIFTTRLDLSKCFPSNSPQVCRGLPSRFKPMVPEWKSTSFSRWRGLKKRSRRLIRLHPELPAPNSPTMAKLPTRQRGNFSPSINGRAPRILSFLRPKCTRCSSQAL